MNLHTNLIADIVTAVSDSTVSNVAGVTNLEWTTNHIFKGQDGLLGGVNRGRKVGAIITRLNSNYALNSLSNTTTGEGGQVDSTFRVTFFACVTSNRRHEESEKTLYALATTTTKVLRGLWDFEQSNFSIGAIESYPFGYQINLDITVNNSWDLNSL